MAIPDNQIGNDPQSKLLWQISKQLDNFKKSASKADPALLSKIDDLISSSNEINIDADSINLNTDQIESLISAGNALLAEIKTNTDATFTGQLIQDGNPVSTSNPLPVSATFSSVEYYTEDVEEDTSTSTTYIGKQTAAGAWLIQKVVDSTVGTIKTTAISYATVLNNAIYVTYTDAWTNKSALVYSQIKNLL